MGWAIWDWKAGFHYWKDGAPDPPGLRDCLFPAPTVQSRTKGKLEIEAAVGKRIVVERGLGLTPPLDWRPIWTQVLSAPKVDFTDLEADLDGSAFYRVRWVK